MMSRKGIAKAGQKTAKKNGEPAIKFGAGIDGRKTGLGSGMLSKGVKEMTSGANKRRAAEAEIMKDL